MTRLFEYIDTMPPGDVFLFFVVVFLALEWGAIRIGRLFSTTYDNDQWVCPKRGDVSK